MNNIAKTKTKMCTEAFPDSQMHECLPCDLPPFCRNHYFTGKLLTARDLTAEQRYQMDKLRLHYLALHGWGVACGLKVKPHPNCPDRRIFVDPGLAIDACGREIWVPSEVELKLPLLEPTVQKPHGEPKHDAQNEPPEQQGHSWDSGEKSQQHYGEDVAQERPDEDSGLCEPGKVGIPLYVCIRYVECGSEMMHAPFDECACTTNQQQPNRICETFHLEILTEKPEEWEIIERRFRPCELNECSDLYKTMIEPCPDPASASCLPLAVIHGFVPGESVTAEMIDNWEVRPLLPSTTLLDLLIRCILEKLPTKRWTQIVDFGWTHNWKYDCDDFIRYFIGDATNPRGFEVTFSSPLSAHEHGLTFRTFQAKVVRYSEKAGGAGHFEIAPAIVRLSDDRLRAYLDIDPEYVRRFLLHTNFDLYLVIRCDLILDENGDPVDGDLLARLDEDKDYVVGSPTGNGIPGGVFESWICVRTGVRERTAD